MSFIRFYTKPYCSLCDDVRENLEQLRAEYEEINIEEDPLLFGEYKNEIPVLTAGTKTWFYRNRLSLTLEKWLDEISTKYK